MFFKLVLRGFKLKKLVVKPKAAQPVELDEEPIDPLTQSVNHQLNRSRGVKNLFSFPERLFNWSKLNLN